MTEEMWCWRACRSQIQNLQPGEFVLQDWRGAGLLFQSAVKRGVFTLDHDHLARKLGRLSPSDMVQLEQALRVWLGL